MKQELVFCDTCHVEIGSFDKMPIKPPGDGVNWNVHLSPDKDKGRYGGEGSLCIKCQSKLLNAIRISIDSYWYGSKTEAINSKKTDKGQL